MNSRILPLIAGLVAVLSSLAVPSLAQTTVPLFGSTDYVTGGDVYTASSPSTHRAVANFGIGTGGTTSGTRNLSTDADYSVNGGTLNGAANSYSGTMPAVYAGFTGVSSGASAASSLTMRIQFQNNAAGDFINVHTYKESQTNPLAAGLNFRLAAAVMFSAGSTVDLGSLSLLDYASGNYTGDGSAYGAGVTETTHRVIVRDALSGNFFISSANNSAVTGQISLAGSEWASVSATNLTTVGSFGAATFSQFDYIGIYSDSSVTTTAEIASGPNNFAHINGFSLSALSYDLAAVPEPSAFAALAGLGALGVAALRRRRA